LKGIRARIVDVAPDSEGASSGGLAVGCDCRALVVDDLEAAREIVGRRLEEAGFAISYASDGLDALGRFARDEPDLVVTDCQMPRLDGIGLIERIRESSNVPVVMVTAFGSIPACEQAMRAGADRYLQLRPDLDRLAGVARELVTLRSGLIRPRSDDLCVTAVEVRRAALRERRDDLQRLLIECRGNIAEMARRMGRDRSTIRYHLRRMGLLVSARCDPTAQTPSAPDWERLGGTRPVDRSAQDR
jgi:DNA-binding NtrC family response regulator